MRQLIISLGCGILLAACQTSPRQTGGAVLNADEVARLFVGNTVESYNLNTRYTSFTYYHPNGQLLQERLWARRTGTWTIQDDGKICLSFRKTQLKCRNIVRQGPRHYKILPDESGKPVKIVRYRYFAEGNVLAAGR